MLRALVLLAVVVAATHAVSVVKRQVQPWSPYTYTYYPAGYRYPFVYYGTYYYYLLCLISPSYCTLSTQAPSATTTTATTTTTTTPPLKLCPPRQAVNSRLLNGDVLAECKGNGIIGFESVFIGGTHVAMCNAVVAPDPANPTSYNIYTDLACLDVLKFVRDNTTFSIDGTMYGTTIPNLHVALDLDNAVTTNGVTVVKPTILGKYFFANAQSTCESATCVYKASTMVSYIDKTKCYVASYGITIITGVASPGGKRVDIKMEGTCANAPAGSECFTALKNTQVYCVGDIGAPVYCATKTGEEVLYGILPYSGECDFNNPTFSVMPITM